MSLDVSIPGLAGLQLRDLMLDREISLPIVVLTGHGDVPTSVDAMKQGAVDFLQKPVDEAALLQGMRRAVMENMGITSVAEWVRLCETAGVAPRSAAP